MFDFKYRFQWRQVYNHLPTMLDGAWVSFYTALLSMAVGIVIALTLLAMRRSQSRPLKAIAGTWVSIARNTPSLLQIYFLYFGLGACGINVSSWAALLAGVTFNNAGYLTENFRGGLNAVPDNQTRAARSLGMTAYQAYTLIVIPQLLRIVFYPITNQMIWALLMTSLGVVVGLNNDLMGVTKSLTDLSFRTFEYFAVAALIYYILAKLTFGVARIAGWKLFRY
ncbi:amino acid ABC transporter permease [Ensifer sp. Root127]|uniref:amino acid ABC transporter permease n=1 Tax=Ensifer sp. Root127 TaxID=1736440 RepID=UPI00070AF0DE|nr:amino acid ABC transporter permease [Ensifer sp. Root127]KQW72434.1 ABC transporter permease [Ensifer sp. Root127]